MGTSIAKLAKKAGPVVGSSALRAKAKVGTPTPRPKITFRTHAKATPVRRVVRNVSRVRSIHTVKVARTAPKKATPVHTYRRVKAVRPVLRRATRSVKVRTRISNVYRKTATTPTARAGHTATTAKPRPAHRTKASSAKIDRGPNKIIGTSVRKATTAKTIPALTVGNLPVAGLAVVTPEITVRALPLQASVSPAAVTVPLLSERTLTVPGVDLPLSARPAVTVPSADPMTVLPWANRPAVAEPLRQVERAATPHGRTASAQGHERTARITQGVVTAAPNMLAHDTGSTLSVPVWAIAAVTPPALAVVDQLGQRIAIGRVAASVAPTATALVLAAAIGAAASGTAGSGSAGPIGLAVLSAALPQPALRGSRRLRGRLRDSAFRRPRLPGFAPD
jgi:hypothetical protein